MKFKFLAAAAICVLAATPALAAEHHVSNHGGGNHGGGHPSMGHSHSSTTRHISRPHTSRTIHTTRSHVSRPRYTRNRTVRHVTTTRHVGKRVVRTNRTNVRVNITKYRRNVTATRRFHYRSAYRRPAGWYAHRWGYGQRFPRGWYGRDYWVTDYGAYGLFAPPYGYQWVRDDGDVLLIDIATGEIIQAQYGLFY